MDKKCKTCQFFRLQKWTATPDAPEPPWCSNLKSPNKWKSVKETDGCRVWQLKKTAENTDELSKRVAEKFNPERRGED